MKKYLIKCKMDNSIIFFSLTNFFGGGEVFLYNLSIALNNYDVHFCICNAELRSRLIKRGIAKEKIFLLKNKNRLTNFLAAIFFLRYAWKTGIRKIVFNGIPEIMYAPFFKLAGFSTFSVIHTEQFERQMLIRKFIYFIGHVCVDRNIFVASHLLTNYHKLIKKKSTIIINQIIHPFISMERISVNKTIKEIIFIGRVSKDKGIDDILEIAIHFPTIHFKVIGPLTEYIETLKNKIPQNITLTGFDPNIERQFRTADVIIFPSKSEGMPYAVLEAVSIGLPSIASIIPAHEEIDKIITGIKLYEPGNIHALHKILINLQSPSIRETLSQILYKSSSQFNNKNRYTQEYVKIFNLK